MTVAEVAVVVFGKLELVGVKVKLTRGDVLVAIEVELSEELNGAAGGVTLTSCEAVLTVFVVVLNEGEFPLTGCEAVLVGVEVAITDEEAERTSVEVVLIDDKVSLTGFEAVLIGIEIVLNKGEVSLTA